MDFLPFCGFSLPFPDSSDEFPTISHTLLSLHRSLTKVLPHKANIFHPSHLRLNFLDCLDDLRCNSTNWSNTVQRWPDGMLFYPSCFVPAHTLYRFFLIH